MAGFKMSEGGVVSEINVTPFVDVVLVLLVGLMLTSSHLVRSSIEVDLPKAVSSETTESAALAVVVRADGTLELDGTAIALERLGPRLAQMASDLEEPRLVISADGGVAYARMVQVIDTAREHGLERFALDVEKESP